jgi:AcrR family transcriptional regulator
MAKSIRKNSSKGKPKGDKRARTRAALIEAAAAIVRERGFEALTQAEVSERAGMTRGALQGNFKDMDELMMAIATTRWSPIVPDFKAGRDLPDLMRSLAKAVVEAMPARCSAAIGFTSWQTYALKNETMRASIVKRIAEVFEGSTQWVLAQLPQDQLPMPVKTFVRVLHALTEGLTYQRFLVPELVTDEVIYAAFAAMATVKPNRAMRKSAAKV